MKKYGMWIAGAVAGAVNGLFGAGGGMLLVPLLTGLTDIDEERVFPSSVSIIFPICIISLCFSALWEDVPFNSALPYLLGSIAGGLAAGFWGKKIPVTWLHRGLGLMILWGGVRYLC